MIIYDRKGLSSYDYEGRFIKRVLVSFNFSNFRVTDNGLIFILRPGTNGHLKGLSKIQGLIKDKNFCVISDGFPIHYSEENHYNVADYTSELAKKNKFLIQILR